MVARVHRVKHAGREVQTVELSHAISVLGLLFGVICLLGGTILGMWFEETRVDVMMNRFEEKLDDLGERTARIEEKCQAIQRRLDRGG